MFGRLLWPLAAPEGADVLIAYLSEAEDAQETNRLVEDASPCSAYPTQLKVASYPPVPWASAWLIEST